jgi:hypothetical protein
MGVSLLNTQLVYETAQMTFFVLIAKGLSITRVTFDANEWRSIIMAMSAFYMANSILLVLQSNVLSLQAFWTANALLYGLAYCYIYSSVLIQLRTIWTYVRLLTDEMPHDIVWPMKQKYWMYIIFLSLVLVSAVIEVLAHSLAFQDSRMIVVLLCYEISNILIMGTIGFTFRPQEYSPFFFMVPSRATDDRSRCALF